MKKIIFIVSLLTVMVLSSCTTTVNYTINFDSNGGSEVLPITFDEKTTVSMPDDPIKEGFVFEGWYFDNDLYNQPFTADSFLSTSFSSNSTVNAPSSRNMTVYAKWDIIAYDITYYLDEGINGDNPDSYTIETTTITLLEATKGGYSFEGWYDNEEFSGQAVSEILQGSTDDLELYAKWEINPNIVLYDIVYHLDEGTNGDNPNNYTIETSTITLLEATKEGYTFDGWFDNVELTGEAVREITQGSMGNLDLYAKWNIITYNITYDLDEGINGDNPDDYTIETPTITLLDAIKENYSFDGWYDNVELMGDAITEIAQGSIGDINLYAKWTNDQYTVSYVFLNDDYDPLRDILLYPGETILEVFLGGFHSSALTSAGRIFMWGHNNYGQLGDGTTIDKSFPVEITENFNLNQGETIKEISLGKYHSSAITSEGRIFMWGYNNKGQLGDGTLIDKYSPFEITSKFNFDQDENIVKVSLGIMHTSSVTSKGRIFMWGLNNCGQLGDGTTADRVIPVEITSRFNLNQGESIINAFLGEIHSSAITSEGRVYTWGCNAAGELGNGTTTDKASPVEITPNFNLNQDETIIEVSLGSTQSSAMTSEGRIFMWGNNYYGQLGNGTAIDEINPVEITSNFNLNQDETIIEISLGSSYSLAITSKGRIFTWGCNCFGQIGDGTKINRTSPTEITSKFNLKQSEIILKGALGEAHSSAITSEGRIFTWGSNQYTQLGVGAVGIKSSPTELDFYIPTLDRIITYSYQETIDDYIPVLEGYTFDGWYSDLALTIPDIHSTMPAEDITLYAKWDIITYNITYDLDEGINGDNPDDYTIETPTITLLDATKEGYAFGGWFDNVEFNGQAIIEITQGSTGDLNLFAKWDMITYDIEYDLNEGANGDNPDDYTIETSTITLLEATKEGYSFEGWFDNEELTGEAVSEIAQGSMGNLYLYAKWTNDQYTVSYAFMTDDYDPLSDILLYPNETLIKVSLNSNHSSVITSEGRVFMWGWNGSGQLGDGTTIDKYSPVEITSNFNLNQGETIKEISLGEYHSSAISSEGRIFMWGNNHEAQLGDGSNASKYSPVEITSNFNLNQDETIIEISLGSSYSSAITSEGRLFTWGANGYGQLGDGTTTEKSSPVDITSNFNLNQGETIIRISLSRQDSSAITSEGRIFMWGWNGYGQLGDGTLINKNSPIEITSNFNLNQGETIIEVSLGISHSSAITSEGRIFTWGNNFFGQLGDGTTTDKSFPVEITENFNLNQGETIKEISLGSRYSSAITSEGRIFMWGSNLFGQIGDSAAISQSSPINITPNFNLNQNETIIEVSLGDNHSSALTSAGRIFMWGNNSRGLLGDGTTIKRTSPIEIDFYIPTLDRIITYSYQETIDDYIPVLEGYTFDGWYSDLALTIQDIHSTMPAEDITLYAKWDMITYDITYNLDEGINGANPDGYTIETPTITLLEATKEGYAFGGWFDNVEFNGQAIIEITQGSTGDLNIFAKWTINHNQYEIAFESNDGTAVSSIIQDYATVVIEPEDPIKEGYTFSGWYSDIELATAYTFTTMPAEDITLYARWIINEYELTFITYYNYDILLNAGETIESISLGRRHSSAITSEGRIFTWGDNNFGQLGDGTATDSSTPIDITSQFILNAGETIESVSLGYYHSSAITSEGRIFTWGYNGLGQLGDGNVTEFKSNPNPIEITSQFNLNAGETIESVSLGYIHSSAITSEGRIFTWGSNMYDQLGDGTTADSSTPIDITSQFNLNTGETIEIVSLGDSHSSAITSEGRIFTWGYNGYGELGIGTSDYDGHSTPIDISSQFNLNAGETIVSISLEGGNSSAITSEGRILTWGNNEYGQLGDGTTTDSPTPIDSTSQFNLNTGETIETVSLGVYYSSAITSEGRVFTWGHNFYGELGIGTSDYDGHSTPIDITSQFNLNAGETIESVSLGGDHSSAITTEGRVFTWGSNIYGQLGDGTTTNSSTPIEINSQFKTLYSIEIMTLDYNQPLEEYIPFRSGYTLSGWYSDIDLTTAYTFTTMPAEDITLYASWTINHNQCEITFESNDGTAVSSIIQDYATVVTEPEDPTKEGYTFSGWYSDIELTTAYTFTTMPAEDITLYARWIINEYELTFITYNNYDILLNAGETIESVSLGHYHSSAITSEGRIFTWGYNEYGQLGDGTTIDSSTPIDITSQFNLNEGEIIESVSLGVFHSSVVTSEGRIFTWGYNEYGQLGNGTTTYSNSTPIDITSQFSLNTGETIVSILLGGLHSSAITSEGRIFTWGDNNFGQLGDGTTTYSNSTPIDITSQFNLNAGETIESVSVGNDHSSAITSEGRVFTWGRNWFGQLGNGNNAPGSHSTPIDITSQFNLNEGETIESVSLGGDHSSAITTEGRVFTWGSNIYGQLGDGTTTNSLAPKEITSLFNLNAGETIESVSLGFYHSSAITSEGRVFTWGYNRLGQLGDGNVTDFNSNPNPIEITSQFNLNAGETIESESLGYIHSSAITSEGRILTWGNNEYGQLGDGTTTNSSTPKLLLFKISYSTEVLTFDYYESLEEYIPIREGYTFSGWYSDIELTTAYTLTTMPAEDIILYASWTLN